MSAAWDLPAHEAHALREKRARYALVVCVLDEGERFRRQLAKMKAVAPAADLVIADGGSRDGSTDRAALAAAGARALLVKTGAGRLGAQLRMGLAWALREGYDGVITVDGNDKDDTAAVPRFAERLAAGADFVQGSRYLPGGAAVRTPLVRSLAVKLIHIPAISFAAGYPYTDTTNGFRAMSARFLLDPRVQPFRDVFVNYELQFYLTIRAPQLRYRVEELPVRREYPERGRTPTKISLLRGSAQVLAQLALACSGRLAPEAP